MSKANNKALDWLPKRKDGRKRFYQCDDDDIRSIYAKGYRKAEKDLELTWEDMECIIKHYQDIMAEKSRVFVRVEDYQEVLERFKDFKERKDGGKE